MNQLFLHPLNFKNLLSSNQKKSNSIKKYECLFCYNSYEDFDDLMHHMSVEHVGIASHLLEKATDARETKKELGDYLKANNKIAGFECPHCFEIFSNLDKLQNHGQNIHGLDFNPKFLKKLETLRNIDENNQPICEKCNRRFYGLVTTRIKNEIKNICFSCYENYFGKNALRRLTIGTPEEALEKMRRPIS